MLNKFLFLLGILSILSTQAQQTTYICFFELNSAEYDSDSIVKMQDWLKTNHSKSNVTFELVSYTDTLGSVEYNDHLAQKRMENISRILTADGFQIFDSKTIGKRYSTSNYTTDSEFRKVEINVVTHLTNNTYVKETNPVKQTELKSPKPRVASLTEEKREKDRLDEFEKHGDNTVINLNIEFKNGTNTYKDADSEKQVYYLAQYLKKHPKKKILILGHVCCNNNYMVSLSRAKKVYEDLGKYNIKKKRMRYKGMSNTVPLVQEINSKAEQQNRRVEVVFRE